MWVVNRNERCCKDPRKTLGSCGGIRETSHDRILAMLAVGHPGFMVPREIEGGFYADPPNNKFGGGGLREKSPMKKHLVILGGDIKGAATAAVTSLFGYFQVTLIECDRVGSGTTVTNHGRLHLGTAGWEKEKGNPALIQHRLLASELVR